jgi:hypothetical protein
VGGKKRRVRPERYASFFTHRPVESGDCREMAKWIGRELPVPRELTRELPALLGRLVRDEALIGYVVEVDARRGAGKEIAAFGLAGFIGRGAVDDYLAQPTGHFEVTLLWRASCPGLGATFLSYHEIAEGNAGGGVTLFPLFWFQRNKNFASPEGRELLMLAHESFMTVFRGYRLNGILKEAPPARSQTYVDAGFRHVRRLPAGTRLGVSDAVLAEDHLIFHTTLSDIDGALPGAAIGPLFRFKPPCCGFTRSEQRVLCRAMRNMTDLEISDALAISANTVAMRWRSIYARVEERAPFVLRSVGKFGPIGVRGRERRRQVISWLGEHPEELRPYAWP